MRIAVTGASGFVGRRLVERARARGHEVIAIGRRGGDRRWDPLSGPAPLEGVEAVVHLAGEPVGEGRWTRRKMARIRESRVAGTRRLVEGLRGSLARVLVCASAVGYYGDRGEEELTEDSPPGEGFLAEVCRAWEAEAFSSGIRTAVVRTGIVLGAGGGALERMAAPFRWGLGGPLGDGEQWMSWIHRDDLAALYLHLVEQEGLEGAFLGTAPEPVRNRAFAAELGRALGRPSWLRVPRGVLRLAAGRAAEMILSSQRCRPARTLRSGFAFAFPGLAPALREALGLMGIPPAADDRG